MPARINIKGAGLSSHVPEELTLSSYTVYKTPR